MSATDTRPYRISFILDMRGLEESVSNLTEFLKETSTSLGAEVTKDEDLGIREFSRTPDSRFTQGQYILVEVKAGPDFPAALKEKLRLDRRVHRIFVENM